jgi:hypothetical protein
VTPSPDDLAPEDVYALAAKVLHLADKVLFHNRFVPGASASTVIEIDDVRFRLSVSQVIAEDTSAHDTIADSDGDDGA